MATLITGPVSLAHADEGPTRLCTAHHEPVNWQLTWGSPNVGTIVEDLAVRIRVGDDDIRQGSKVLILILLVGPSGPPHTVRRVLNVAGDIASPDLEGLAGGSDKLIGFPNGSVLERKIDLRGEGPWPWITIEQIQTVMIVHESRKPGPFDTDDNWDMSEIQFVYRGPDGHAQPIFSGAGTPWLHRFKKNCDDANGEGGPDWEVFKP